MNADAVQAATDALFGHWKVADDETSQRVASLAARRDAEAAVAAAEPIIRAQIAAEVEADCIRRNHDQDNAGRRYVCGRCTNAARIARGGAS